MLKLARRIIEYVFGEGAAAETIRYVFVGGLTTLVNYGLFELLYSIIGIDVTVSNVTSIVVAILFAYIANKQIVFRRHSGSMRELTLEFFKFIASRLFTMALEIGGLYLFHNILGYDAHLCKVAAQVLVIISNYVIVKLIVFRSEDRET